jgi:hypothetical protein
MTTLFSLIEPLILEKDLQRRFVTGFMRAATEP